ncbi:MAG: GFA family protein [Rhizomicrobium sp.]|jgi:hypothetical protein
MKIDGGCHCGAIAYEAEIDPEQVGICHCTDCQMLTGSAYRVSVPTPGATFRLLRGAPQSYIKTTAESGTKRRHAFCGTCGSPLYACAIENPPAFTLRVGTIRQRAELAPKRQIWCRSALPWSVNIEGVPGTEKA